MNLKFEMCRKKNEKSMQKYEKVCKIYAKFMEHPETPAIYDVWYVLRWLSSVYLLSNSEILGHQNLFPSISDTQYDTFILKFSYYKLGNKNKNGLNLKDIFWQE